MAYGIGDRKCSGKVFLLHIDNQNRTTHGIDPFGLGGADVTMIRLGDIEVLRGDSL